MGTVAVRDHALWIKHIDGDPTLVAALNALPSGATVLLEVDGFHGEWRKMATGSNSRTPPGLVAVGVAKEHWHGLQRLRGTAVPIALSGALPASVKSDGDPVRVTAADHAAPDDRRTVALPAPVAQIYRAVEELEAMYPGRKFTPDGHLVGSIGEVVAAEALNLSLHPASYPGHDAMDAAGRQVQIKLTRGKSVSLYATCDRLVVLRIVTPAVAEIVFDGDGDAAWRAAGPVQRNGQRVVSLSALRRLSQQIASFDSSQE